MSIRIIFLIRILAIPATIAGTLAVLDVMLPASVVDEAVVQSKDVWHSKGTTYNIQARGKYSYSESVSREFYTAAEVEMRLRLSLTRMFKEWKQAELFQNDRVILTERGKDIYWMPPIGLLLTLPCLSYRKASKRFSLGHLIVFGTAEFASVLLFSKLVLVWLGFAAKM